LAPDLALRKPKAAQAPAELKVGAAVAGDGETLDARLVKQAEEEKSAEDKRREEEAALRAAKEADLAILNRVYSPEIEAERQRRLDFYLGLGVPKEDAQRLVARILAAYSGV